MTATQIEALAALIVAIGGVITAVAAAWHSVNTRTAVAATLKALASKSTDDTHSG
jgi:hypothetical protein